MEKKNRKRLIVGGIPGGQEAKNKGEVGGGSHGNVISDGGEMPNKPSRGVNKLNKKKIRRKERDGNEEDKPNETNVDQGGGESGKSKKKPSVYRNCQNGSTTIRKEGGKLLPRSQHSIKRPKVIRYVPKRKKKGEVQSIARRGCGNM